MFAISREKKLSSLSEHRRNIADEGVGDAEGEATDGGRKDGSERRFYLGAVTHTGFSIPGGEQGGARFLANQRVPARVGLLFGID